MNQLTLIIDQLAKDCYENSKKHGFWEGERNKSEMIALMHEELSEALTYLRNHGLEHCPECPSKVTSLTYRQGKICWWVCSICGHVFEGREPRDVPQQSDHIPDFSGVEEELVDVLIRVFDFAGGFNLRLGEALVAKMVFNETRPHKHGKTF